MENSMDPVQLVLLQELKIVIVTNVTLHNFVEKTIFFYNFPAEKDYAMDLP